MAIVCKSPAEIEKMRASGRILRQVLDGVKAAIAPGVTTMDLERVAENRIKDLGATPAFKGYHGYPCVLCTSVNNEIIHGIPSDKRVLQEGDIISVDCGVVLDGFYADSAFTAPVGNHVRPDVEKLLKVTEESLYRAIEQARVGKTVGDIGSAVQRHVEANGFSVVREFVGHGIGTRMHEEPNVPNYGTPGYGAKLREGMVIAIEPMVNIGKPDARVLDDDWTAVTVDGTLSAHFEHSVAITKDGPVVLTQ